MVGFFVPNKKVLAADSCTTVYASFGLSCVPDVSACDTEIDSEKKNQIGQQVDNTQQGTLINNNNAISGVCDAGGICCVKKVEAGTGAAGAAGAGSTNSNGESCGPICQWITKNPDYAPPKDYVGPIPDCAFSGQCRNTNDIVDIFIRQGKAIFGLIGMVALAAFVYGGFLMVFSFGSSDKVQQGKDVMVAAVVGIIIVFSAYLIVNFILGALGVSSEFKAIN